MAAMLHGGLIQVDEIKWLVPRSRQPHFKCSTTTVWLVAPMPDNTDKKHLIVNVLISVVQQSTKFPEIPVSLERNTEVFRHPLL